MSTRRSRDVGIGCVLLLGAGLAATHAHASVSGWVVDWREDYVAGAIRALEDSSGLLDEIAFFRLHFNARGEIAGDRRHRGLEIDLARRASRGEVRQIVTIVNDVIGPAGRAIRLKDPDVVHRFLDDPARRLRTAAQLRDIVVDGGYDGLDLDLENLYAHDRDAFTAFVVELAVLLHREKRRLIVTVHPQTKHERRNGPGAQDLAAIARSADEVRIMAYHVHHDGTAPGPSTPRRWLESLLAYNLSLVPAEKLSVAYHVGGWQWQNGRARQTTYRDALALAQRIRTPVQWSEEERMPFIHGVTMAGPVTIWFENGCSLLEKRRVAREHGLRGIALWHLGKEDPALYASLKADRCMQGPAPAAVPAQPQPHTASETPG